MKKIVVIGTGRMGGAFATAFAKRTSHVACALVHAPAAGKFADVVLSQCAAARVSLYERQDHHRPQALRKGTHHEAARQ